MDSIGLGIVGTGNMAQAFARCLPHAPGLRLAAVASRQMESAQRFAAEFGDPQPYGSLDALLADPAVDLVYVAGPHSNHCADTLAALDAGKAVLCEKPFAINAGEAARMIARAREKRLFLMEAMWTRYVPAVVRLRELLAADAIGRVNVLMAGGAFMPPFDPKAYLFRPDLGGGVLLDAGIYLVSFASMLFGAPQRILATASLGTTGVDEHDAFVLQHAGGELASLYVSLRARRSPEAILLGTGGSIRVHPPIFRPARLTLSRPGQDDEVIDLPFEGNGYQFEAIEAARCVREGRAESAMMPLDESLSIMHTMDEIRRQIGLTYPMEN